mmetsp:Transcript_33056/g.112220  ORF Transcript_33056/g.112220 Transcript_33056/m.112220 type:complete len:282 (-) Transcript_33056:19-864(-)
MTGAARGPRDAPSSTLEPRPPPCPELLPVQRGARRREGRPVRRVRVEVQILGPREELLDAVVVEVDGRAQKLVVVVVVLAVRELLFVALAREALGVHLPQPAPLLALALRDALLDAHGVQIVEGLALGHQAPAADVHARRRRLDFPQHAVRDGPPGVVLDAPVPVPRARRPDAAQVGAEVGPADADRVEAHGLRVLGRVVLRRVARVVVVLRRRVGARLRVVARREGPDVAQRLVQEHLVVHHGRERRAAESEPHVEAHGRVHHRRLARADRLEQRGGIAD